MSVPEEQPATLPERIADRFQLLRGAGDAPRVVTAGFGLVAAMLVASSTLNAFEVGYTGVGVSVLAATALFLGTVSVFEAGRRIGAAD